MHTIEEGLELFADQPYKVEIIQGVDVSEGAGEGVVSAYRNRPDWVDLCRGPHVPRTSRLGAFKLQRVSAAYWRGDEHNQQLQRIYGTAWESEAALKAHLAFLEEAEKRDHRRLGAELDLFSLPPELGGGLVLWHPKGARVRRLIEDFSRAEHDAAGYELAFTPHLAKSVLWETSGHLDWYADGMYPPMEMEGAKYYPKPMNCPFHILIYRDSLKSYRDLPVRLGELGTVYRYERSGVMHGLLRVRGFTQDDAHIFCTRDQIEDEIAACVEFAKDVLKDFGFEKFQTELSTWNPNERANFVGSEEQWNMATSSLEKVLKKLNIEYKTIPGEAAFYGPKIDIKLVDAIGRLWQLSTVQFDFNLPQRFNLEYVAEDGSRKQPLMVHRALYGSVERFFGVLIEHYAGAFPVWLSPVQAVMIPISERHAEYANKVADQLKAIGVRVEVDARNEKMNSKIREHAMQKVPFLLVVGDKEAEAGKVNVRTRGHEKTEDMAATEFVEKIRKMIAEKSAGL
jgi:threonyl-tRNA synthetase